MVNPNETIKLIEGGSEEFSGWITTFFQKDPEKVKLDDILNDLAGLWTDISTSFSMNGLGGGSTIEQLREQYRVTGNTFMLKLMEYHTLGYCWDALIIKATNTYFEVKAFKKVENTWKAPKTTQEKRDYLYALVKNSDLQAPFRSLALGGVVNLTGDVIHIVFDEYMDGK